MLNPCILIISLLILKGNRHGLLEKFFYCLYAKLCLSYFHILNISEKYQLLPKIQLLFAITSC